jgi:hypothetical protein
VDSGNSAAPSPSPSSPSPAPSPPLPLAPVSPAVPFAPPPAAAAGRSPMRKSLERESEEERDGSDSLPQGGRVRGVRLGGVSRVESRCVYIKGEAALRRRQLSIELPTARAARLNMARDAHVTLENGYMTLKSWIDASTHNEKGHFETGDQWRRRRLARRA